MAANDKTVVDEDLAIQSTLSMPVEDRIKLLANLITNKISEDLQNNETLYDEIKRLKND